MSTLRRCWGIRHLRYWYWSRHKDALWIGIVGIRYGRWDFEIYLDAIWRGEV